MFTATAGFSFAQEQLTWSKELSRWEISWLSSFYNREYVEFHDRNIDFSKPPFDVAIVELSEAAKGQPALIVQWNDTYWCGSGGCQLDIWVEIDGKYQNTSNFLSGGDLTLGKKYTNGYRDLWLQDTRLRWTGKSYEIN